VPVSPFVHPPLAAAYEPFADEPSFVTLPVKLALWPFSLSVMLIEFPLSVPTFPQSRHKDQRLG